MAATPQHHQQRIQSVIRCGQMLGVQARWQLAPGATLDVRRLPHRLRPLVWLSGGQIRCQAVQVMLDYGYVDGYRKLHTGEPGFTFPTWDPHLRLDYLFLTPTYAERLTACQVIQVEPAALASDHFPLLSVLEI